MGDLLLKTQRKKDSKRISVRNFSVELDDLTFVYDGTEKTQTVENVIYDGTFLEENVDYYLVGNKAINAGTHKLVAVDANYPGVEWEIQKAQGSVTITEESITIYGIANTTITGTTTYTYVGDGNLSVSSSDETVATAEINNGILTINSLGVNGNAVITITMADGNNYLGESDSIAVTVIIASSVLADNTPTVIQGIARGGIGENIWSVGDKTAIIEVGAFANVVANSTLSAYIIGFNHNSEIEGEGITFLFGKNSDNNDICFCDAGYGSYYTSGNYLNMKDSNSNTGGWESSKMRTTICPLFLQALPSEWQNIIVETTKYTSNTGGTATESSITTTNDKIFLLSEYEVLGTRNYSSSLEYSNGKQAQYDYYKNGNSKMKYKSTSTSTGCLWFLRSPYDTSSSYFCVINTDGSSSYYSGAYYSRGFAPAFKVA